MADLVPDGGLENNGQGHELSGYAKVGTTTVKEGLKSLEIIGLFGLVGGPFNSTDIIPIETDFEDKYTLSAFVNGDSAKPSQTFATNFLRVSISSDKQVWTEIYFTPPPPSPVGWIFVEFGTFEGTGDTMYLRFQSDPQVGVGVPDFGPKTWYIDEISIPVTAPVLLGGDVKFKDIYDAVAFDAGDFSSQYRNTIVKNWMPAVRAHINELFQWKAAYNNAVTLKMVSPTSTGIYPLIDSEDIVYEFVAGHRFYSEEQNLPIPYIDPNDMRLNDPDNDETGSSRQWTDAGFDDSGRPQIQFHPLLSAVETLVAPMYRRLTDLPEDEGVELDPQFGPVTLWVTCFLEGLRYFAMKNDKEAGTTTQWKLFERLVRMRHAKTGITITRPGRLSDITLSPTAQVPQGNVSQGVIP